RTNDPAIGHQYQIDGLDGFAAVDFQSSQFFAVEFFGSTDAICHANPFALVWRGQVQIGALFFLDQIVGPGRSFISWDQWRGSRSSKRRQRQNYDQELHLRSDKRRASKFNRAPDETDQDTYPKEP